MMAEISPVTGGAPEAIAIPSESGIPIMATCSPAIRSYRKCFSPATPFWGFSSAGISSTVTVAAPCDDMPCRRTIPTCMQEGAGEVRMVREEDG
jgi:hypothetical protein